MTVQNRRINKDQKLGIIVVEVVRATNEGRSPTTQQELRKALKPRRVDIPRSTFSGYIEELEQKGVLKTDGHDVTLVSESNMLTDSLAIDVLLHLYEKRDENDCFSNETWLQVCRSLKVTEEHSAALLSEYKSCGYLLSEKRYTNSFEELNVRSINEELFYLQPARKAKLKKFPSRASVR